MLDRSHAKGTLEVDLIASAHGQDLGVGTAVATRLATEVVLQDLLTLGRHVSARVLTDISPVGALDFAVDGNLREGVVGTGNRGQRQKMTSVFHVGEHLDGRETKGPAFDSVVKQGTALSINERVKRMISGGEGLC